MYSNVSFGVQNMGPSKHYTPGPYLYIIDSEHVHARMSIDHRYEYMRTKETEAKSVTQGHVKRYPKEGHPVHTVRLDTTLTMVSYKRSIKIPLLKLNEKEIILHNICSPRVTK